MNDLDLLAGITIETSASYKATADKDYDALLQYSNVTSYSQLSLLHQCPRKFQLSKYRAAESTGRLFSEPNLHFCFGHAVGAGAQNWLLTKDLNKAWLNAMLAWRADFDARLDRDKKSLWEALIAVEKFAQWEAMQEYEILHMPDGTPAIELSVSLHAKDGYKHYSHLDLGLRHTGTGRITIADIKTEGTREPEEAKYGNSNQATGYSIILGAAFPSEVDYEVLYLVYCTLTREWHALPFKKNMLARAEVLKDILLDHSAITVYEQMEFYPKRGESCYAFRRRCEFYGECNLVPDERLPKLPEDEEAETPHLVVKVDNVIQEIVAKEKDETV